MKKIFVPLMALFAIFLVVGTANAVMPASERFVTEQWYLVDAEEEPKTTCLVCVTHAKFVDPIENDDWYLMDDAIEGKVAEQEVVQEFPEATFEDELDDDAWYLK